MSVPPDSDASRHEIARMQGAYAAFAGTVQANIDNLGSEFANDNASAWINYGSFLQDNIQLSDVAEISQDVSGCMMEVSQLRSELRKGLKKFAQSNQAVVSTNQQFLGTSSRYQADKISLDKSIKKCLLLKPTAPESELREKDMAFSSHKQQHEMARYDMFMELKAGMSQRQHATLDPLVAALKAYKSFFAQGHAIMEGLASQLEVLEKHAINVENEAQEQIKEYRDQRQKYQGQLEKEADLDMNFATASTKTIRDFESGQNDSTTSEMQGYLYSNQRQVYVVVKDGTLTVRKEDGLKESVPLMICTTKDSSRAMRFQFEVVTPSRQPIVLQAENNRQMMKWINVIQCAVSQQLESTPSNSSSTKAAMADENEALYNIQGNRNCADCGEPSPTWTSLNLGILLCLSCSGIHRALGVHISQVRSLQLDQLDGWRMAFLEEMGNSKVNAILEATLMTAPIRRPASKSSRAEWEKFIRAKYEQKMFLPSEDLDKAWAKSIQKEEHNKQLCKAVRQLDLDVAFREVILGAQLSWGDSLADGRSALLQAVKCGSSLLVEMLLLNGANLQTDADPNQNNVLHVAAECGDPSLVMHLLTRGARDLLFAKNKQNELPENVAAAKHLPPPPPLPAFDEDAPPPPPPDDEDDPPPPPPPEEEETPDLALLLSRERLAAEVDIKAGLEADMKLDLMSDAPPSKPSKPKKLPRRSSGQKKSFGFFKKLGKK